PQGVAPAHCLGEGRLGAPKPACREDQPRVKPMMVDEGLDAGEEVVDRRADTPLWLQLRLHLKRQIEDGALSPGEQLPSEAELCERFNVSRTVVREALGQLVIDGRIYKIKGKGAFVSERKSDEEFVGTTMGFWEEM